MGNDIQKSKLYTVLFAGILAVSTGSIFARIAEAHPLVISAYRVGLAGLVLLPFSLVFSREEIKKLNKKDWLLAMLAGVFLALHFYTWITSLKLTTVAASVVLVTTNPVWVALLSFFMGERITFMTAAGIIISFSGALLIGWNDFYASGHGLSGDILALAGALFMTGYLLSGRILRKKISLLPYVTICYCAAGIFLWSAVLLQGLPFKGFPLSTWLAFPAMALIPQVIGHTSYNWALRYLSAPMIAVSLLGEPVISPLLAWIFLDEFLTLLTIAGSAVIMTGVFLASRGEGL